MGRGRDTVKKVAAALAFLFCFAGFSSAETSLLEKLKGLDDGQSEFLPPDEAFVLRIVESSQGTVADWLIAEGYYLYRHKTSIVSEQGEVTMGLPPGKTLTDEYFGQVNVFRGELLVPFEVQNPSAKTAEITVSYQGCADAGICYPPINKLFTLAAGTDKTPAVPSSTQSEQSRVADLLVSQSILLTVLAFIGFGVLLAFTPCVLPMVPILSGIITSGERKTTKRAFSLSLSYVLAMAVVYSIFGMIVGLGGENFQIWFQKPAVIFSFAAVFVILALSMFGLFELQMPARLQTRFALLAGQNKNGSLPGAAVMGGLSALIVGPCITAPLVGALLFIARTGDALTGAIALFSLGMGMGIPLLVFGTSLGSFLPKPGPLMDMARASFGFLMLGVALWLLDRVLPAFLILFFTGCLLIFAGTYVHGVLKATSPSQGWLSFGRGISLLLLLYGTLLVAGAATGGHSLLRPLVVSQSFQQQDKLDFQTVESTTALAARVQEAGQSNQVLMLDFYADWCVSCKEMEAFTFSDPQVQEALSSLVLYKADVTENNQEDQDLLKKFNLFGPPAILFFDTEGRELKNYRLVGFLGATKFISHIKAVLDAQRKDV